MLIKLYEVFLWMIFTVSNVSLELNNILIRPFYDLFRGQKGDGLYDQDIQITGNYSR